MKDLTEFEEWLRDRELSENTIRAYIVSMNQFFESYDEISKKNGIAWKRDLIEKGMKPKTVNLRLNGYNSYCKMNGMQDGFIRRMKVQYATAVSNVIPEKDYKKLLSGLMDDGNLRGYFLVKLLATTGARVSEAIRLTKADLNRGYAELWTKGKVRRIYIPKSFIKESKEYYKDFKDDDYLLKNRYGGQFTTRGVAQDLVNWGAKYGIDRKYMHPHGFRHYFAIQFLKRNANLTLLADVMGHSSVATTAVYTRMSEEQQKDAVNRAINW